MGLFRASPARMIPAVAITMAAAGAAIAYERGAFDRWLRPVLVAVLESGADSIAARVVERNCASCKVLAVKIARQNDAPSRVPRAEEVASAIRYAVLKGAEVIDVSFGMNENSAELEAAIADAGAKSVVVIAAAGTGVVNPFRPDDLSDTFPQAYSGVIVVGAAKSLEDSDMLMNHGDELDVVVTGQPEGFNSSLAAAMVSGTVAEKLRGWNYYEPEEVRSMLRASARTPALSAGPGFAAALSRVGFGAFDRTAFLSAERETVVQRVYRDAAGGAQVEISATRSIESLGGELKCPDPSMPPKASIRWMSLKKGRGRVVIEKSTHEFSLAGCALRIVLAMAKVGSAKLEATF